MRSYLFPTEKISQVSNFLEMDFFQYSFSKTKVILGVALGAILLSGVFYFSREKRHLAMNESDGLSLPTGEAIRKMTKIEEGFSNNLWKVETETKCYILRSPKKKDNSKHFKQVLEISKQASNHGISPKVIGENVEEQLLLLEYIESGLWPSYESNPQSYKAAMKVLKCFHEKMPLKPFYEKKATYAPFRFIFNEGETLKKSSNMPIHFTIALEKMECIFDKLKPWLEKNATLCHGDFHKGNVLIPKENNQSLMLIDFDSMSLGHPFFDVAKFSISLAREQRFEIFNEYLGGRQPTSEEIVHFELMDLALLMVIATVRFKSVHATQTHQEKLSKGEIEAMLDSKEPLPSFLSIPFGQTSPKARQTGATYALSEFLRRSAEPQFSQLLEIFEE